LFFTDDKNVIVNKDIIGNLALIAGIYITASFWLFDITDPHQRSVCFYFLLLVHILYTMANNAPSTVFLKTTDYSLPFAFSGILFGVWFCITDWLSPFDQVSKFSGVILIFSTMLALVALVDIGDYFKNKKGNEHISVSFLLFIIIIKLIMLIFALPFFINGKWDWTIISFGELIDFYTSPEYIKPAKRLF
jgi:hypothetical protein